MSLSTSQYDQSELIPMLKAGSPSAWEHFFNQHHLVMLYKAIDILGDTDAAKDAVQDLFTNLWNNRAKLQIQGSLESFLYKALKNRCIDHMRSASVYKKHKAVFGYLNNDGVTLADNDNDREAEFTQMAEAMYQVSSDPNFPALKLMVAEHKNYQQIADDLGMHLNSVKNQISRARKKIRSLLK